MYKFRNSLWRSLKKISMVTLAASLLVLAAGQAGAQLSSAKLNGVVRDPSGAVIPKATVVLHNVDTSVDHVTLSNDDGAYSIDNIPPGKYTIEGKAKGFSPKQVTDLTLEVSQASTINFTLTVGSESTVINVDASAVQLEVASAELGTVIATKQVNDLPLNGRNFTQLLQLTPGVSPVSTGQNGMGGRPGGFAAPLAIGSSFTFPSVNGQTNRSNYFLTDGLNNFGTFLSTYAVPPIVDAIQEFKVVSHPDTAEYGSVLGGVINVVTKGGTNEFHGSGWEYLRKDAFDARTYFLPKDSKKAAYTQNQFGGSIGGPVRIPKLYDGRNKTFFYGAYQGFKYSQTSNTNILIPTAAQLGGDLSNFVDSKTGQLRPIYNPFTTRIDPTGPNPNPPDPKNPPVLIRDQFPGNIIPKELIDPKMVAYANAIWHPEKDAATGPNPTSNQVDTTPTSQTQHEWDIRIDEQLGANDSAWFRYSAINSTLKVSGGLPGLPKTQNIPGRDWGGSYVHIFSPSLTLQAQYARTTNQDNSSIRFTGLPAGFGDSIGFAPTFADGFVATGAGKLIPGIGIGGFTSGGENIQNDPKATDSHQFSGSLTKVFGKHEFKVGTGWTSNRFAAPYSYATVSFGSEATGSLDPKAADPGGYPLASFLLNVPHDANRRNVDEATRMGGLWSSFIQDTWRVTPNLTLNLGLRYDFGLIPPYGTNATIDKNGGIETGDWDFHTGQYILQKVPPPCSVRLHAPCLPGDGTVNDPALGGHVIVDPRGKIAHNTTTNIGPRVGFAYRLGSKTVIKGAAGIIYDNWAAVSQTSQNIEGSWPDIGQLINNSLYPVSSKNPLPSIKAQDPFAGGGGALPSPTPFNNLTNWFYDPHLKNPYSMQYNLGVQRELNGTTTVGLNYVGSQSRKLDVGGDYNTAPPQPSSDANVIKSLNPFPYTTANFYDRSVGNGEYNAFQFELDRRYTNGVSYAVAYTYSQSINEGADGWFGSEGGEPVDPYHPAANGDRSVAGTDLTNVLSVNTLYQVPVGRGKKFSTGNGVVDYLLGNWQINNIFRAQSGNPFTPIYGAGDRANTGNQAWAGYEHANLVGSPHLSNRGVKKWFNTAAYATPASGTFGTATRNSLRSAPFWNLDSSIFRQFPLGGENRRLEFRAEGFNVLNHAVLGSPNNDVSSTNFGQISGVNNTARQFQFGAHLFF